MPPHQVADIVFQAIRDEKFYILTQPEWKEAIRVRIEDILQERQPKTERSLKNGPTLMNWV